MRLRAISILASIASIFAYSSYCYTLRFLSAAVLASSGPVLGLAAVDIVLERSIGLDFLIVIGPVGVETCLNI